MAFNLLDGLDYVQQQGNTGRARYADKLLGQAYAAPPEQRQSALAKLAGTDGRLAMVAENQFAQRDDDRQRRQADILTRRAKVAASMPPEALPQLWPSLRASIAQEDPELGAQLPEAWDESFRDVIQQFAGVADKAASVRSSFVGEDGQMYSIMSDGSVKAQGIGADRKLQAFDVPGFGPQVVDLRNATARTVTAGGGQAPQAASQFAFTPAPGTENDPAAAEFQNLPPDQQQAAANLLQRGQDFRIQDGKVVPVAMRGGQPMSQPPANRPLPPLSQWGAGDDRAQGGPAPAWVRPPAGSAGQSAMDRRIELARQSGASEDDIRRMILGRDAAAGGSKPMPASVLKMREQTMAEAETANTINMSIDKHLNRIRSGSLGFGMVDNALNQGRNAVGASTEQSRNFAEFRADLEKLRNDSLRLNAGVQTDGDAKRAWDELVANINDTEYVKQRLETIRQLNERAALLKQASVERIDSEYGKTSQPAAAEPAANGWGIQRL